MVTVSGVVTLPQWVHLLADELQPFMFFAALALVLVRIAVGVKELLNRSRPTPPPKEPKSDV